MIEQLQINDIFEVVKLEQEYLGQSLGYDFIYNEIINNKENSFVRVYKEDNKIIGYLIARITDNKVEIINLITISSAQRKKIATQILENLIKALKAGYSIILEVRKTNFKAINFYEKQGFKMIKVIPNYYKSEDALIYLKED